MPRAPTRRSFEEHSSHQQLVSRKATTRLRSEQAELLNTPDSVCVHFPILSEEGTRVADPLGWCHLHL